MGIRFLHSLIHPLNPTYAKVTLKYRILMDSKNPMRAGVLELGEQIKQKFSRNESTAKEKKKKKNCEEKYEKILIFQKNF
jgi:hypothetical protein